MEEKPGQRRLQTLFTVQMLFVMSDHSVKAMKVIWKTVVELEGAGTKILTAISPAMNCSPVTACECMKRRAIGVSSDMIDISRWA